MTMPKVSSLEVPSEDSEMMRELRKRYEAFELETRGRAAKTQQTVHRVQYGEQFSFFREGGVLASVVSEEVGVLLGKLKALSAAVKLPIIGEMVDELYVALERQLVAFFNEMKEKYGDDNSGFGSLGEDGKPAATGAVHQSRRTSTFALAYDKHNSSPTTLDHLELPKGQRLLSAGQQFGGIGRSASILRRGSAASTTMGDTPPPAPEGTNAFSLGTASLLQHSVKGTVQPGYAPTSVPLLPTSATLPSVSNASKQKITVSEGLSATTSLLAESLAVSLRCEIVRIYLVDEKKNLRRAAEYPFLGMNADASNLDLFGGNYTERGLAKSLFSAVCEKALAVSGQDARQSFASAAPDEPVGSNKQAIRSCLVWPIVLPSGHQRVVGMVHALNKEGTNDEERRRFTSEDELTMHHAAKMFGVVLDRYPRELFQIDVGALIFKACHAEGALLPHLPAEIVDVVEGAQRIGNEVLRTNVPIIIYRGPMVTIYKQASREKKAEDYAPSAGGALSTITTVEYNLDALNDLWKSGYDENVMMHEQCRAWSAKVRDLHAIIKQFVDSLVVARGMKDMNELLMYLRSMELLIRSENAPLLGDHITNAMETIKKASMHGGGRINSTGMLPAASASMSPIPDDPLHATQDELQDVSKRRQRSDYMSIATIHIDGPTNVRGYTCDPESKRAQVRAIDGMIEKHRMQMERNQESVSAPTYAQPTSTSACKITKRRPIPGEAEYDDLPAASRRMVFSARAPMALSPVHQTPSLRLRPPAPPVAPPGSARRLQTSTSGIAAHSTTP